MDVTDNEWAPFLSADDFTHTILRQVLGLSRDKTRFTTCLYNYSSRSRGKLQRCLVPDISSSRSTSLERHMAQLPLPVIHSTDYGSEAGFARVDFSEYLARVFLCNPVLSKQLKLASLGRSVALEVGLVLC